MADEKQRLTQAKVVQNPYGGWNVEQFDDEGGCYVATFTGPYDEWRAREYAAWCEARR